MAWGTGGMDGGVYRCVGETGTLQFDAIALQVKMKADGSYDICGGVTS